MFNIFVKSCDLEWHLALFEIIICMCAKCSCFLFVIKAVVAVFAVVFYIILYKGLVRE